THPCRFCSRVEKGGHLMDSGAEAGTGVCVAGRVCRIHCEPECPQGGQGIYCQSGTTPPPEELYRRIDGTVEGGGDRLRSQVSRMIAVLEASATPAGSGCGLSLTRWSRSARAPANFYDPSGVGDAVERSEGHQKPTPANPSSTCSGRNALL